MLFEVVRLRLTPVVCLNTSAGFGPDGTLKILLIERNQSIHSRFVLYSSKGKNSFVNIISNQKFLKCKLFPAKHRVVKVMYRHLDRFYS